MDTPQQTLSLEESVKQVMQTLPPVIRTYLAQGKYTTVAKSLMTKYALRLDQGGVLEREIMLLLMGIENPDEFTQALTTEASLNQQTVSGIVQDVNAQIFVPLRQEMMRAAEGAQQPPKPVESSSRPQGSVPFTPPRPTNTPTPTATPAPGATEPPRFFHLDNRLPPRPAQVPVAAAVLGTPVPPPPVQPPKPIAAQPAPFPQPPRPMGAQPPTQTKTVNILNTEPKPEQPLPVPVRPPVSNIAPLPPKIVLPRPAAASIPRPILPVGEKPSTQPTSTPPRSFAPPPPNLPGAMPPTDIMPPSRPTPAAPKVPQAPVKPYSSDPYREPIE